MYNKEDADIAYESNLIVTLCEIGLSCPDTKS